MRRQLLWIRSTWVWIGDRIYLGLYHLSLPSPGLASSSSCGILLLIPSVGFRLFWVMIPINSNCCTLLASLSCGGVWRAAGDKCWIGWEWRLACCYWTSVMVWPCGHMRCSIEYPPVASVPFSAVPVGVGFFAVVVYSCRAPAWYPRGPCWIAIFCSGPSCLPASWTQCYPGVWYAGSHRELPLQFRRMFSTNFSDAPGLR